MNSNQYEELSRYYLADILSINVGEIRSVRIPSPRHPNLPEYKNQIDLYWETSDKACLYLNVANAKWRGRAASAVLTRIRDLDSFQIEYFATAEGFFRLS
jgi:hypothetical protein